jgi:hypothetical protein
MKESKTHITVKTYLVFHKLLILCPPPLSNPTVHFPREIKYTIRGDSYICTHTRTLQQENIRIICNMRKHWDICNRRKTLGHLLQKENIGIICYRRKHWDIFTGRKHWDICYRRKILWHLLQEEHRDICYRRKTLGHFLHEETLGHLLQEENFRKFVTGGKHWNNLKKANYTALLADII